MFSRCSHLVRFLRACLAFTRPTSKLTKVAVWRFDFGAFASFGLWRLSLEMQSRCNESVAGLRDRRSYSTGVNVALIRTGQVDAHRFFEQQAAKDEIDVTSRYWKRDGGSLVRPLSYYLNALFCIIFRSKQSVVCSFYLVAFARCVFPFVVLCFGLSSFKLTWRRPSNATSPGDTDPSSRRFLNKSGFCNKAKNGVWPNYERTKSFHGVRLRFKRTKLLLGHS